MAKLGVDTRKLRGKQNLKAEGGGEFQCTGSGEGGGLGGTHRTSSEGGIVSAGNFCMGINGYYLFVH